MAELFEANPGAGVGLVLGDPRRYDGADLVGDPARWVVDLDVDDPDAAAPVLARLFPDGMPETARWESNRGGHWLFTGDERLARYGATVIKGETHEGRVVGNPSYLGIEIRVGTIDPARPQQLQTVIPPSLKTDGSPREWAGGTTLLSLPDCVYADLDAHAMPEKPVRPPRRRTETGRPSLPADRPGQKADQRPEANGKPRKAQSRSYDRDDVLDAITADSNRLVDLLLELGVVLTGRFTSEGWMECHAIGREDTEPSAGVSTHGVYHDFGTGERLALFDLAARLRPGLYADWRAACNSLGERFLGQPTEANGKPTSQDQDQEAAHHQDEADETPAERRARLAIEGSPADPRRLANAVVHQLAPTGTPPVAHYCESFWEYTDAGPCWVQSPAWQDEELVDLVNDAADRLYAVALSAYYEARANGNDRAKRPERLNTARLVPLVRTQLRPIVRVGKWCDPGRPFWIEREPSDPDPATLIPCQNGLLDCSNPTAPRLLPHTPRYFASYALPFAYDPAAPRPALFLDRLLGYQWADDPEQTATLQEWFGYCLTPDTSLQKMLVLHGEPGTGKGIVAGVLRLLLGEANCAEMDSKALADSHGTEPLPGKTLITFSDSRTADNSDNLSLLQFLLLVVGGDPITINPKGKRRFTATLMAKVMMLCNVMPQLRDATGAMDRRFLVLHTARTVAREHIDPHMLTKLKAELPGILNWALEGRARLLARGRFEQPKSAVCLLDQARHDANNVLGFVEERCTLGTDGNGLPFVVGVSALYQEYTGYCMTAGTKPFNLTNFGPRLQLACKALGHPVERVRENDPDRRGGKLPAEYHGIRLV